MIKPKSDEELEFEYLLSYLSSITSEINSQFHFFHAFVDRSGYLPQLYISKKQAGRKKRGEG